MENFQVLPIGKLFESPLNPRRSYDPKKMAELIESIRSKSILTPLLVRPNDGRFEIGAGHRRYRAALELKFTEVPAIIREMSDADFLELLTIENLQREDIRPLDEAQGYRTLMEKTDHDVAAIALKVGKSESYIYQRLKLLELIPEAQKQLAEDKITAGHAILIARLQPDQQKDVLEAIEEDRWDDRIMSVREVADYVERNIHLDLNSASFSKKDPDLVPSAGACTTCPKRTGFAPQLFPDIKKKDTCTDPDCFHAKVAVFIASWIEKKSQDSDQPPLRLSRNYDGRIKNVPEDPKKPVPSNLWTQIENKKEACPSARDGIVVDGHGQGHVMTVCADPKCKSHHGHYESTPETQKWRAQQKAAEEKRKQEKALRLRIVDTVLEAMPADPPKEDLAFIAEQFFEDIWADYQRVLLLRHEIKAAKSQYAMDYRTPFRKHLEGCGKADLYRLLMEMALIRNADGPRYQGDRKSDALLITAERHKVKVKAIEAEMKAEAKEKAKKKKSPSVKQKSKFKSGVCRVCGCTDDTPCEGGCAWTDKTKTLCTVCAVKSKAQTSAKKKK